ncbi:ImmA/IrrE family metallo-endopeptidase [Rubrobacter tropicus]|uniref:ImmA/IrrE family metallo-endopeptidase n=1 Tax=Rubrobacter tropicus TaxID=2653851 RepID=A0A6G8QDR5_9ACTN|nr:XRE family transcriptional regulator [Rubrobacter tropicus]QIN84644.1 ImmA/IrrE family metallo-endopeptidase [Rubrobacter tropicus]
MITQEELGGRLRRARERAGYTQEEAGRAIGLDDTAVAKMERGKRGVGALEVKRLASFYGTSTEDLLEDPTAEGEVPLTVAMRATAGALGPKAGAMKRRLQRLVADDRWLREDEDDAYDAQDFPALDLPKDLEDLERGYQGADLFRERHGLGHSPIADVAVLADELGVIVARMPLGGDERSPEGCSALDPQTGVAYVLINSDKPRVRRRFTIAHELGHLALGHLHGGEMVVDETVRGRSPREREANAFAAGLLMPEAGVADGWQRLERRLGQRPSPIDWIVWLAASFGVSDQAAAYRLVNLGRIHAVGGTTADSIKEMSENPEMLREAKRRLGLSPVTADAERGASEVGPAMRARVARALEEGAITVDGAAEMLHQPPEDIYRWVAQIGIRLDAAEAPL